MRKLPLGQRMNHGGKTTRITSSCTLQVICITM